MSIRECTEGTSAFEWEVDDPVQGGYFDTVRFVRDSQGEVMALTFKRTVKTGEVSPAMEQVRDRANEIVSIIRQRFKMHGDKESWLRLTYNAARNGTLREDAQPEVALADFDDIEQMLMVALRPQRQRYIAQLFGMFLFIVASTGLIYFLLSTRGLAAHIHVYLGIPGVDLETWIAIVNGQIATLYGLAIGILFSGIVENRIISKQSLRDFDPEGFSTLERLLYLWIAATTLQVFLWFDVVTIGVGSVVFNDIKEKAWIGLIIGLVTALATEAIVAISIRTAKTADQRNA